MYSVNGSWWRYSSLGVIWGLLVGGVLLASEGMGGSFGMFFKEYKSLVVLDSLGMVMSFLTISLGVCLMFLSCLHSRSRFFLGLSVLFGVMSYLSMNAFIFWVFYEVSMMCALYLLMCESPYSERYLAAWYLGGYLMMSSLPMLVCMYILGSLKGSFVMSDWSSKEGGVCYVLLFVMFVMKVPIPPFHVWLPLVHAEASSPVSVILSGYIMKLGVVGLLRLVLSSLPAILGCWSVSLLLMFGLLFFLVAYNEVDGKRWLAFLSLSHMLVVVVMLVSSVWCNSMVILYYCLGHGLTAGMTFMLIWWGYEMMGSRKFMVLKSVLGANLFFQMVCGFIFCSVASFPLSPQFMAEVDVLGDVMGLGWLSLAFFLCFFLFVGSLIPLVVLGFMVSSVYVGSFNIAGSFQEIFVGFVWLMSLQVVFLLVI